MPASVMMERATMTRVLLQNATIHAGEEHRILPNLEVKNYDRLHIHVGRDAMGVDGLSVRVLFSTPLPGGLHCGAILADSTVWFEEDSTEHEFSWTAPLHYGRTGFIVSVPVVAPVLYDVILRNTGPNTLDKIYVTLMAQEV